VGREHIKLENAMNKVIIDNTKKHTSGGLNGRISGEKGEGHTTGNTPPTGNADL